MQENIKLSEKETKEINKMMKDREPTSGEALVKLDELEKTEKVQLTEEEKAEYEAALAHSKQIAQQLKRRLKLMSKSQLIQIIITYASDLQEMQGVSRQLFEENQALKGVSNENPND